MTRSQLVICGLGGQGIIFLTRVVAEAAMHEGSEVLAAETHGMSQRGGAVQSCIKVGGYSGSLVRRGRADAALVLDASRLDAARSFLRADASCFVDAAAPLDGTLGCDASGIARELEHPRGANLVLLGFAAATKPGLFPGRGALLDTLTRLSPPAACDENRRALEHGASLAGGVHG